MDKSMDRKDISDFEEIHPCHVLTFKPCLLTKFLEDVWLIAVFSLEINSSFCIISIFGFKKSKMITIVIVDKLLQQIECFVVVK